MGIQFLVGPRDFSFVQSVLTSYAAHPALYTMGNALSFHVHNIVKRHEADHTPPSSAQVNACMELQPLSPLCLHAMVFN